MKMRLVISPTGEIGLFSDEGTFDEGKVKIESLIKQMQSAGMSMDEIGQVEQHRHDPDGRHVHLEEHAGQDHDHHH